MLAPIAAHQRRTEHIEQGRSGLAAELGYENRADGVADLCSHGRGVLPHGMACGHVPNFVPKHGGQIGLGF